MTSSPLKSVPVKHATYWQLTRRLTLILLSVWFLATFGVIFFARELSGFSLFGWPFSFYMAAQGLTLIYVILVAVYAWGMRHLDKTFNGVDTNGQ